MGRRCLPFTFPSNVFNFARPAYCRRNKSKSLSALRDPGLFLFCAPPLAAASWARKKRRIPDAEKVVSFFSCFLRNSPLASHLVPPESLANPHFSHFLPSHPALSRISQLSCLFTLGMRVKKAVRCSIAFAPLVVFSIMNVGHRREPPDPLFSIIPYRRRCANPRKIPFPFVRAVL